jgi:cysteine desulfurase
MIYLDHAATSPLDKEILDTFVAVNNRFFANTSSSHKLGFEVGQLELKARQQIAQLFSRKENEIIFTSGATESNNIAIKGVCFKYSNRGKHIITSLGEHASVLNVFKQLESEFGFKVTYLPLNEEGVISYELLEKSMTNETILVSLMAVNNEVGSIHDIQKISNIVKKYPKKENEI